MSQLLNFNHISITIPRKQILNDLEKNFIDRKKFFKYRKLKKKTEIAQHQLAHLNSLLEKLIIKSFESEV